MERARYDAIIVGGGLAGSSVGTLLARTGAKVLILEREKAFRDRVRGEWLAPWGVAAAKQMGVWEAFEAAGAHKLPQLVGRSGKPRHAVTPEGDFAHTFGHPAAQESLLRLAEASGVEVQRGAKVLGVENGGHGQVEFSLEGQTYRVEGRLVVGADGRSSLVRRAIGSATHERISEHVLAGIRLRGLKGDSSEGYYVISGDGLALASIFPLGGGEGRAYVFRAGDGPGAYAGPAGLAHFLEVTVAAGVPEEVVEAAEAAGPLATFKADDRWLDEPAAGSLVVVGDAAGMSDPTWGMGMALALQDARTLAAHLGATSDWESGATAYGEKRREYFRTIITGEGWQTELQLSAGEAAVARRRHAMRLWSLEPRRALDLPGLGPAVDVSEEARRRFFGEDVPMEVAAPAA